MINSDREQLFADIELPPEHFRPAQSSLERWLRKGLLAGFFIVLVLEGWLLAQALLA